MIIYASCLSEAPFGERARHLEKSLKKPEKSAEKQLTTVSVCDKIAKLSEADVRNAGRSSSDEKNLKKLQKSTAKTVDNQMQLVI